MHVLLHDHVGAPGEGRVLNADQYGAGGLLPDRVLRTVDEAEQVALVQIAETGHLVGDGDRAPQPSHDLRAEGETEVLAGGPDVEDQVARGGRGVMAGAAQLPERVQLRRARTVHQPVPGRGADARNDTEPPVRIAETDRALQPCEVGEQLPDDGLAARIDGEDEEERGGGQRTEHGLRQVAQRSRPLDSGVGRVCCQSTGAARKAWSLEPSEGGVGWTGSEGQLGIEWGLWPAR